MIVREPLEGGEVIVQRVRPGCLLTCDVAVLDDITRAPGEALNVLLRILNEPQGGECQALLTAFFKLTDQREAEQQQQREVAMHGGVLLLIVLLFCRRLGRKRNRRTLRLRLSTEDDRLAPLFVDPERLYVEERGTRKLPVTLTVSSVAEPEMKVRGERGLRLAQV